MNKIMVWSIAGRRIDREFAELDSYILTIQIGLKNEQQRFNAQVAEEMAGLDDDAADERAELYAEDFHQLKESFPAIARRSNFLMIYSTFEHALLDLCWRVQKITKQDFGPQDLRGEFSGAQAYLDRMAKFKMSGPAGWKMVDELRQVRNKLAHQGGYVRQADTGLLDIVKRSDGLSVNDDQMLCVTDAYCLEAIETLRTYLQAVLSELQTAFRD